MLNYLLSVTPVAIGEYMLASWLGMMPITLALVYVGTTLKDLSDVTHGWGEVSAIRWVVIASGLVFSGNSKLIKHIFLRIFASYFCFSIALYCLYNKFFFIGN
uniref:Uncharacterized protein n=1 Tax=Nelumbo nucifera TaxID=4432 RepID=A0A822YQE6_NELNU|nr:TPA_asm: hypothetical protein HUJ06_012430 [Nelumbo nucifera]